MPSIYAVIFGFRYLSISVLLRNEEKHVDILLRKIIRTERKKYFIFINNIYMKDNEYLVG